MNKTVDKVTSGRLILTCVGAYCFYLLVDTICQLLLSHSDEFEKTDIIALVSSFLLVISNIFTFYFTKSAMRPIDEEDTTGKQTNQTTENSNDNSGTTADDSGDPGPAT